MGFSIHQLPPEFQSDVRTLVDLLKDSGAREVYLFGSLVRPSASTVRDIDVAVRGLPPSLFFRVYGQLMMRLDHDFDLVDLDGDGHFVQSLVESGTLERVA
jgi:predicted nucleotidyltransferase